MKKSTGAVLLLMVFLLASATRAEAGMSDCPGNCPANCSQDYTHFIDCERARTACVERCRQAASGQHSDGAAPDDNGHVGHLGITAYDLWRGIHSGCGRWLPCLNVQHFERDSQCFAQGNCMDFIAGRMCLGSGGSNCVSAGDDKATHSMVSDGKDGCISMDYETVGGDLLRGVIATSSGECSSIGAAMFARVVHGALPHWEGGTTWAAESFLGLSHLGGDFPAYKATHPVSAERLVQLRRQQFLTGVWRAGGKPVPNVEAADDVSRRYLQYLDACGDKGAHGCKRDTITDGVNLTMIRLSGAVIALSINAVKDRGASNADRGGTVTPSPARGSAPERHSGTAKANSDREVCEAACTEMERGPECFKTCAGRGTPAGNADREEENAAEE